MARVGDVRKTREIGMGYLSVGRSLVLETTRVVTTSRSRVT
jgi:hypothetical protein